MIFIDRSVPKSVVAALQQVRNDVEWLEPRFPHNIKDTEWLPIAGQNGWLVILRDKKVRTRPGERAAIRDNGVGCFIITVKRNINKWEYLKLLVAHMDDMEALFARTQRPFIYTLDSRGIGRSYPMSPSDPARS